MRLIDADALRAEMYHEAFEKDTDMQKWDSGCWIRYKMFENAIDNAPTVDAVPVVRCKDCKKSGLCEMEDRGRRYDDNFYCAEGEIREDCIGDCDYCYWKTVVPGTDERIDREPAYYCRLFDDI